MAAGFDSFGLQELIARPEDALRLAGLAMAEGQRIPGYQGEYFRYYIGDAVAVVRTMSDPESGEPVLLGIDTHAVSKCVWDCRVERDVTPHGADPLSRRVLVSGNPGEGSAVVDVLCAEVLPVIREGSILRLNMAGFPLRVDYSADRCNSVIEAQEDTVLLQGVVKDAKVGETYLGMEPLTKFLSVTASTPLGDVELCHPMNLVAEGQRDNVKPGAVVSALCRLSGNAAVGEYAGGIVFSEENNLQLLQDAFLRGGWRRLTPALRGDCIGTFLQNRQEGADQTLALLEIVGAQMREAGFTVCTLGVVAGVDHGDPPPFGTGTRCLMLGSAPSQFAFLCFAALDSLNRIREIVITNDSRYDCEPDLAYRA